MSFITSMKEGTHTMAPVNGFYTSRFGTRISPVTGKEHFHTGLDIATKEGALVVAFSSNDSTAISL